ncbi:hypothetical protein CSHOW_0317 [Campylobacter showae]|uniref:AbiTii domain-containing protein n=1 Tax=Campylobacter showae RM3277 TaxID=553219 RepID=C6REC4_9BACT|nr:hypothetical protein [Campylobacter showae]EET80300.1 hypothetical protein CAMSH0001_2016 [Campylobacter showae RM3277]QCD48290.1 hypothetical protein CSHOW_0317 [Campylobacter showae]
MDSIVIDIQKQVLSKSTTDVLRQAYIIARKLKIKDFEIWINNELNGYKEDASIPEYRNIFGDIKGWNPYHGWVSVIIENIEMYNKLTMSKIGQGIPELENIINRSENKSIISINLPDSFNQLISDGFPTKYRKELSPTSIIGIIETVKNIIMEWILKLEEDGIIGVDMKFTDEEKKIASEKNYTVNNFYGNVSNSQIQQNSNYSSQTINNSLDIDKIVKVLELINTHKKDILVSLDNPKNFEKELDVVNDEVKKANPSKEVISQSFKTIRNILEGIAGNLIVAGILYFWPKV